MLRSLVLARSSVSLVLAPVPCAFSAPSRAYSYFTQLPSGRENLQPTPEVPDVTTFLKKIGRGLDEHADKFESWETLVKSSTRDLKAKGIDTRDRRYILTWLEKFSHGEELRQHKRGKKRWGGERRRKEMMSRHYGKISSELRKEQQQKLEAQLAEDRKRMEAELY